MRALQSRQPLVWGATLLALLTLGVFGVWIVDLNRGATEEQPLLNTNYRYFVDETNELSLDYVMAHAPFTSASGTNSIPWKLAYQTYWIKIDFNYTGLTERSIHVITDNPSIDYLDAYHILDGEQVRRRVKAGDITLERLNQLPLPESLAVTLLPDHENQLLIKVTSRDMATMPLWIMSHESYDQFAKSLHLVWGGFMTLALLMAFYSAGVYAYSRQRVYLIYVLAIVLSTLVLGVNSWL
ncbi:7TMR-DISMED2 domain-containing protein [Salinivibrio socompensis]|uniref:7TMR-DISMED2 domain-containing protein n=1 Tax=Salinivibrio socompensis TaxID=1510206 RepID=UPI000472162B|nr:7TM-DISM domain-containing protein [Salinivibrio socompensis]